MEREGIYAYTGFVATVVAIMLVVSILLSGAVALTNQQDETEIAGRVVRSVREGLWSNPDTWDLEVPREGDTVIITRGTEVIYNIQSSPILNHVIVYGRLVFSRDIYTLIDIWEHNNIELGIHGSRNMGARTEHSS